MAKRRGPAITTRKHLARAERERILTRYLLIGTGIVLLIAFGLIGYGVITENFITPNQPVAFVNGESILTDDLQTRVKYERQLLVNQYIGTYNQVSQFAGEPNLVSLFTNQLAQVELQLDNTDFFGQEALNTLIDEELIRQEAAKMGIVVTDEEIDQAIEEAFGFFENGTPVPTASPVVLPTSTLSAEQFALVSPTPEPTNTPEAEATATPADTETDAEPTPTLAPTLVPTEFTRDQFETTQQEVINSFDQTIGFDGDDLRNLITIQELQRRVFESVTSDVASEEEQVWARHILVEDEATAQEVLDLIADGEDWTELAADFSTDEGNKNRGGDLGWFGSGRMVAPFESAAFSLEIGEISEPVQTDFGWHIIQVLGKELRTLSTAEFQSLQAQAFETWLVEVRTSAEIETLDIWIERVPTEPSIPPQYRAAVQQLLQPQFPGTPLAPGGPAPDTDPETE